MRFLGPQWQQKKSVQYICLFFFKLIFVFFPGPQGSQGPQGEGSQGP